MKLTMLGTGNALVTECYNTCFVLEENNQYLLVDGGGGNGILHQLKHAKIIVETLPAVTHCEDCLKDYPTVKYGKICPHCGSEHTYLLRGNELTIKQIEAVDTEE